MIRVRDTKVDVTGNHKLDSSQGHAATSRVFAGQANNAAPAACPCTGNAAGATCPGIEACSMVHAALGASSRRSGESGPGLVSDHEVALLSTLFVGVGGVAAGWGGMGGEADLGSFRRAASRAVWAASLRRARSCWTARWPVRSMEAA